MPAFRVLSLVAASAALCCLACSPDGGGGGGAECVSAAECAAGESCVDSRCVGFDAGSPVEDAGGCPEGRLLCRSSCVDPQTNPEHCGGCDLHCLTGESCVGGECLPACAEGETRCGTECVRTSTDVAHCGACDGACGEGEVCESGSCVAACAPTDPPVEICDGADNDCDGRTDPGCGEGLALFYRFEETEGSVLDASGNGLHAEAAGGVVRGPAGREGTAIHFDGLDGTLVSVPDHELLHFGSALTAEAWIYPVDCSHGGSGHNTVVAKEGELLLAFDNTCRVATYVNNGAWTGDFPGTLIAPGRWTHLAVTYDGTTIRSYVDGNAVGTGTTMTGPVPDGTATLYIGARPDCCSQTFHGRIDEVKIWTVVRTSEEICADAGGTWLPETSRCRI